MGWVTGTKHSSHTCWPRQRTASSPPELFKDCRASVDSGEEVASKIDCESQALCTAMQMMGPSRDGYQGGREPLSSDIIIQGRRWGEQRALAGPGKFAGLSASSRNQDLAFSCRSAPVLPHPTCPGKWRLPEAETRAPSLVLGPLRGVWLPRPLRLAERRVIV